MNLSYNDSYGSFGLRWGKKVLMVFGLLIMMILAGVWGGKAVSAETNPTGCNAGDVVTVRYGISGGEPKTLGTFEVEKDGLVGNNFAVKVSCEGERYKFSVLDIVNEDGSINTGILTGNSVLADDMNENGEVLENQESITTSVDFGNNIKSYIFWMSQVEQKDDIVKPGENVPNNAYDPQKKPEENVEENNAETIDETFEIVEEGACYDDSGFIGWIICPIIEGVSNLGNWLWGEVETDFMQINVGGLFKENDGVRKAWSIFRDMANVVFVILFLFVIFSQLTGIGIDNYGIKKILPKLIVVAILINLSYLICLLAVDLSNILGSGLNALFSSIANQITPEKYGISAGQSLVSWGLGGGAATGGLILFSVLTGPLGLAAVGAAVGLTVLGIVITVVVSIVFLYLILVIRYAGVVILIAIAPIAIVCYMLPNTEKLSKRWVDLLKALLMVYPICGALVGAGKLAGNVLASTGDAALMIAGMIVSVAPFFLIPMLLKRSLALAGNIGATLSNMGRNVGRGTSKAATGAITGSQRFKDWSQFKQDRLAASRASRIQRRLQAKKDSGVDLGDMGNEKLLRATETMNKYNQRRAQGTVGDLLIDQGTMEQKMRAQQSNTLEKMYTDNYMKMTNRDAVDSAFQAALMGDSGENAAAAMNALIQKGGTTEVLNALSNADWSKMNSGVKSYLAQTMGTSNVDALKGFSKYQQSGGQASFQEWSTGSGATIAAEQSNNNIKAKSYAQHLMEGGENAMVNYSKDEMQFVERNADTIRTQMGNNGEFGAMIKNNAIKSGDAKAQTVAESIITKQLADGGMNVDDLKITSEDIGNMRGKTAEAILNGEEKLFVNNGVNPALARNHAASYIRTNLDTQINDAKNDPTANSKMKTETRDVFINPLTP